MKEPVSLDLFPVDVLPPLVDTKAVFFARNRLLFWIDGFRRGLDCGVSCDDSLAQLGDALFALGGLGGVW